MATYEKISKVKIGKMGQEGRQTVLTTAAEGCYKTIKKKRTQSQLTTYHVVSA